MKRQNKESIGSILISTVFISIALIISILLARNQLHNDETPGDSDSSDSADTSVCDTHTEEITIFTAESSDTSHECLFDISVSEPTCSAEGFKLYTCECGESFTETLDKLSHNYTETLFPATCTEKGSISYSCICGDSYSVAIEATGHSYSSDIIPATCTSEGYTEYLCACGDTYTEKNADKTEHVYTISAQMPASCTAGGYTEYLCSCGSGYTDRSDKLEHSYIESTVPATCTENGFTSYTCSCGDSYTLTIEATGHSFSQKTARSTCAAEGYTSHICDCGYSYRDSYTSITDHKWSDWKVSTPATTACSGSKYRKCSLCSKRETASIPKKIAVNLEAITPISVFEGVSPRAMEAVNAVLDCIDKYYETNNNDEIYLGVFELTRADVTAAESAIVFYCGSYYNGFKSTTFYYIDDNHHHLFVNLAVLRRAESERREMMSSITETLSGFEAGSDEHLIDQVFNFLADNISYDSGQPDATVALKKGKGSCNAYPILFKLMLGMLGIKSEICIGYAYTGNYHAWNRIETENGSYIYYDLTFYLSTHSEKYYASASLKHDLCAVDRYLDN